VCTPKEIIADEYGSKVAEDIVNLLQEHMREYCTTTSYLPVIALVGQKLVFSGIGNYIYERIKD
jgi:hypothetical protein